MINVKVIQEIHALCSQYEQRWGKEVDYIGTPENMNQENLLQVLRIIVKTGDSIIVGFQKRRALVNPYYEYLAEFHKNHTLPNGYVFDKPFPLCNSKVAYYQIGNSYEYKCETEGCFTATFRGL